MKKNRALRACITQFDALLSRNDLEPEQRRDIEACRKRVRELGRIKNPTDADVFRCIREISEKLLNTLRRK